MIQLFQYMRSHIEYMYSTHYRIGHMLLYEPVHEQNNNFSFRQGPTQTGLCSYRIWLEVESLDLESRRTITAQVLQS